MQRVQEKADPGAIGGTSPQWGQELAGDFRQLATGFVSESAHIGVFDAALSDMVNQPLRTRLAVSVTAVAGSEVDENTDKPISQMAFRGDVLEARKGAATVVHARVGATGTSRRGDRRRAPSGRCRRNRRVLLGLPDRAHDARGEHGQCPRRLGGIVRCRTNRIGLALVFRGDTGRSGTADIHGRNSWSTGFSPDDTARRRIGLRVLVSDQLGAGEAVLFDAGSIAATSEAVTLSAAGEASVNLGDSPGTFANLWQQDLVAVRAERWYGSRRCGQTRSRRCRGPCTPSARRRWCEANTMTDTKPTRG